MPKMTRRQLRQIIREQTHDGVMDEIGETSPLGIEITTLRNEIKALEMKIEYLLKKEKEHSRALARVIK